VRGVLLLKSCTMHALHRGQHSVASEFVGAGTLVASSIVRDTVSTPQS
jgi:hypothetical protein